MDAKITIEKEQIDRIKKWEESLIREESLIIVGEMKDECFIAPGKCFECSLEGSSPYQDLFSNQKFYVKMLDNLNKNNGGSIGVRVKILHCLNDENNEPHENNEPLLKWNKNKTQEIDKIIGFDKIKDDIRVSIQAGKHLILYGPPGTGKTMIAKQLAECFGCEYVMTTATPEWTAIDTLGGPYPDGVGLADRDGVITKAIRKTNNKLLRKRLTEQFSEKPGQTSDEPKGDNDGSNQSEQGEVSACWVVIDEINRAKLDVALGPFFTMMDSENNTIHLSNFIEPEDLHVPDTFRIIGTMNTIDKNFLNRFPEALKRRFAWIKVDVPDQKKVGDEFETLMKQEKIQIGNNNKQENPWYYRIQDCVEKLRYGQAEQNGKTVPVGKGTPLYPVGTAIVKDALKLGKEYQGLNENEDEDRQDHQKLEGEALNKYIADRAMSHTIIPLLESIDFYNNDKTEALENIFTESDYPSCWKELRSFYPEE